MELETFKKNNKRKLIYVFLTIIMCLGVSLAAIYFVYVYNDTRDNELKTGLISIAYTEGSEIINLKNQVPVIDEIGLTNTPYTFTVTNTSAVPINLKVEVETSDANTISLGGIRYALYINDELIKIDNIGSLEDNLLYVHNNFKVAETLNVKLIFWIDYYYENSEEIFDAKIKVTGESFDIIYDGTTDASCFTTKLIKSYVVNQNMTDVEHNNCVTYMTSELGAEEEGNTVDVGETYEAFCQGTGTLWGYTFQETLDNDFWYDYQLTAFEENNVVISTTLGLLINDYNEACGSDVVIPEKINGIQVIEISSECPGASQTGSNLSINSADFLVSNSNDNYLIEPIVEEAKCGFNEKNLTSVLIPNGVITIGDSVFRYNQLTSVVIPDSVTTIEPKAFADNSLSTVKLSSNLKYIGSQAFRDNSLTNISIPDGVTTIEWFAFTNNQITEVTLPSSVSTFYCDAFDSTVVITKDENLVCKETPR